jgi:hypothetical protein
MDNVIELPTAAQRPPEPTVCGDELPVELRAMLSTFVDGPKVWDAPWLAEKVRRLVDLGLLEPVPGERSHQLSAQGRASLRPGKG